MPILEAFAFELAAPEAVGAELLAPELAGQFAALEALGLGEGATAAGAGATGESVRSIIQKAAADAAAGGAGAGSAAVQNALANAATPAGVPSAAATPAVVPPPAATVPPPVAPPAGINTVSPNPLYDLTSTSRAGQLGITAPPNALTPASSTGLWSDIKAGFNAMSPLEKGMATYLGINALRGLSQYGSVPMVQPYSGPLTRYSMSPNFQPSVAVPNIYRPRYAEGGIAQLAEGGQTDSIDRTARNLTSAMDYYRMMERMRGDIPEGKGAPKSGGDVGIYYDTDPDTQRLDALTAAQVRMGKINARTGMQSAPMQRPTALGRIDLKPQGIKAAAPDQYQDISAAQGGVMQASGSLGGYAAGGNPRLLRGPGDGMSDNIPATIAGKQPARLADGEFVVPADVVSHLGNGSTEAGANKLHQMMTNVRKARTGNPKQGKQINPDKYMPKR